MDNRQHVETRFGVVPADLALPDLDLMNIVTASAYRSEHQLILARYSKTMVT